ncbi:hypothetical protein [Streptomyces sp. NPDC017991]|uniref:hypothetical protein n=1 Tax=Streptomyces sp. NPDC017991 TaxID=3365026 RepID=UPI00379E29AA
MIDDGGAYKLILERAVKRFELDLKAWPWPPERASEDWGTYWRARFEDTLFRVGLGVRKLIEAAKLSVEVQELPIGVTFMPLRGERFPGVLDQHRIEEFYDAEAARPDRLPLLLLCHAIVHSYVLVPCFDGSAHTGLLVQNFYLASDRGRKKGVYLIEWRTFVDDLVRPVTTDAVNGIFICRLPNGEELRIPTSSPGRESLDRYASLSQGNAKSFDKFMQEWRAAYGLPPNSESI